MANIGKPEDAEKVLQYDGEGVGLFRTEFLFKMCIRDSSCTLYSVTIFLARRMADALILNSFNPNARSSGIIMGSLAASPHIPHFL